MKTKYQRMSKKEKKTCKIAYYNTKEGNLMRVRLFRLSLTGTIGILFSLYILTNNYLNNKVDWTTWVSSIPLLIASIIFITASFYLRRKNLNLFAIKEEKKAKKNGK